MSDSLILGVTTGAGAGAIVGNQSGGGDHVATGAAIGAVVGGLSAYLIHKSLDKRDEQLRRETLLNLEKYDVSAPQRSSKGGDIPVGPGHALTKPTVDVEWVETRVDGDKLVEGHKVWRITEKSKWVPDDGKQQKQEKKK